MDILFFSCIDLDGKCRECQYGGPDIESGLDILNDLVREGIQLIQVQWRCNRSSLVQLPVEAFDGCSVSKFLKQLEQECQLILSTQ